MKLLWSHSSRRVVSLFLCAITLVYLTGCNFYKVVQKDASYISRVESKQVKKKLFLHNGYEVFQIKNLTVFNGTNLWVELANPLRDTITMIRGSKKPNNTAEISQDIIIDTFTYPPYFYTGQTGYHTGHTKGKVKIPVSKQKSILKEVHIYTNSFLDHLTIGENVLSIYQLQEIRIIQDALGEFIIGATATILLIVFIAEANMSPFDLSKAFSIPVFWLPR